jgi:branched-chain amino acid transport system permease protein
MTTSSERSRASLPLQIRQGSPPHRFLQVFGLAVLVGLAIMGSRTNSFQVGLLTQALIYATAIAGLNLVTGYTGMLSIGHSAFFGIGAYTTGILVSERSWNPLMTFLASFLICFVVGLIVGLPALRIRGINLALVTLALAVAFPQLVNRFPGLTGGSLGLNVPLTQLLPPRWTGIGMQNRFEYYYWIAAFVLALALVLCANLTRGRAGLAMRATRDNETAANSVGVNLAWIKVFLFGISAAVTGIAGSVFAMYLGSLSADSSFTLTLSISLITGLVIGGVATVVGPIIGGLAVIYIPHWTENLHQGQTSGLFFGVILIFLMFVMPDGLVGLAKRLSRFVVRIVAHAPEEGGQASERGRAAQDCTESPEPGGKGDTTLALS